MSEENLEEVVTKNFIENEIEDTNLVKLKIKEEMPINSFGIIYAKDTINRFAKIFVELVLKNKD